MGSTAVHIEPSDPPAHTLALVTACAVRAAIDKATLGRAASVIKWPNDILIGNAKLAGILLERVGAHLIIGIGVNIASAPELPDRKTTSLSAQNINLSRNDFADALTEIWLAYIAKWRNAGVAAIAEEWLSFAHPIGTKLQVAEGEYAGLTGEFDGLEDDGALRLRQSDGTRIIIHAGDIALGTDLHNEIGD